MKKFKLSLSIIILITSVILCQQIISNALSNKENKNDYAELNHIKYGLFSINEWKRQITVILAEEIQKLYLSRTNEAELRKHIELQLNTLIDRVDKKIREENKGSAEGWIKQSFINIFVSLDDIKKGIPGYADAMLREMKKAKTKKQIQVALNKQLEQYLKQTFDTQDTSHLNRILLKTDSKDIASARINLDKAISRENGLIVKESILLIVL
jgi:hypothetical protein